MGYGFLMFSHGLGGLLFYLIYPVDFRPDGWPFLNLMIAEKGA